MASPLQPQQELTAPGEQRLLWGSGAAGAKRQPSGERAEGLLLLELRRCPRPPAPGAEREEEEDEEEEDEEEDDEEEEAAAGAGCCPKCKKRVQFADSLGLSLASVKHFSDAEEPRVPPAALSRLQSPHVEPPEPGAAAGLPCGGGALLLEPDSDFPDGGAPSAERLQRQRVCLERLCRPASAAGVRGTVQVLPSGGPAEVTVRYTFNEWLSFMDAPAEPLPAASTTSTTATSTAAPAVEAPAERYGFTLCVPPSPGEGSALHFAVRYRSQQGEYWDNNQGRNYTLRWCRRDPDGDPGTDGTGRGGGT